MRTRNFDATLMCGITDSAQGMGNSRSRWDQKEDPIPKFSHFQTPMNSHCALEPNIPSLWDLRAERRETRENAGFWK